MPHPMSEPWLDWQPAMTAPKIHQQLLLVDGGDLDRVCLVWWHDTQGWMNGDGRSGPFPYQFEFWAKIPASPARRS
jgi:hypothetical protein